MTYAIEPESLLDHEIVCPKCNGNADRDDCGRCDGLGVLLNDRRMFLRTPATFADDFTRMRNAMALEVACRDQQIDALLTENRRLREAVAKAARVIEVNATQKGVMPNADAVAAVHHLGRGGGRRSAVLTGGARSVMDEPLNPDDDPPPFAAVRP